MKPDLVTYLESSDGGWNKAYYKELYNISDPKTVQEFEDHLKIILADNSSKVFGGMHAKTYLFLYPEIGKQYLTKNKLKSSDDFLKHTEKLQTKARKGKGNERKAFKKQDLEKRTSQHLSNILQQAKEQSDAMDKEIAKMN